MLVRIKKTAVITFRTDVETKYKLVMIAAQRGWSVAHVAEWICKQYFEQKDPEVR